MGRSQCLYLSSICSSKSGLAKSQAFSEPLLDPSCYTLATERVVCRPSGSSGGSSSSALYHMEAAGAIPCEKVSQEVGVAKALRPKTVKQLICNAGFSKEAAEVASANLRKSMAWLYHGK